MVGGKAMIDLWRVDDGELDGERVATCPTKVITLNVEPFDASEGLEAASRPVSDVPLAPGLGAPWGAPAQQAAFDPLAERLRPAPTALPANFEPSAG